MRYPMMPLLALALAFLSANALAQTEQAPAAAFWAEPEIVEVQAAPGPAVWHLTRGDSELWVLGTVGAMPDGLSWNKTYLGELLDGAREILLPPRPSIGVFEGAWFLLTHGSEFSLPRGQTLEPSLEPELRARFIALREKLDETESRYRTDTPMRAALRLFQDLSDKLDLTRDEPRDTIRSLARAKRVPFAPIAKYEVLDAAEDVLKLNLAQQKVCLAQSVEDVDRAFANAVPAAEAWAVGDIRTVKAHYGDSRLLDCVTAAVHAVADINERNVADYTAAILAALDKPGKAVAVIDIGPLLRRGGVLERLKMAQVAIEGPAE
ncbi:MAG: TraB/GumN family protein [Alphaproteobacteria bacterium]|nr:TraB/GumN family protein [Alphaproteobacteria bacterium]